MEDTAKKRWPWLKIALIASVALNLLVIGVAVGAAWKFSQFRDSNFPAAGIMRGMPAEARAILRGNMQDRLGDYRDLRRQGRVHRMALADAVAAEPLDVEAARAALAQLQKASNTRRLMIDDVLIETLSELTADQRQALAASLRKQEKRRPPRPQ